MRRTGHLQMRVDTTAKARWRAAAARAGLSLSAWVLRELDRASVRPPPPRYVLSAEPYPDEADTVVRV